MTILEMRNENFSNCDYRSDMVFVLLEKLFQNKTDPGYISLKNLAVSAISVIAKYQDPGENAFDNLTFKEVEADMLRLTAWSAGLAIAGVRTKAQAEKYHAMGKKVGAEALMRRRSSVESEGGKFITSAESPVGDIASSEMYIREQSANQDAAALLQLAEYADKIVQVLKKVHDRFMKEFYTHGT